MYLNFFRIGSSLFLMHRVELKALRIWISKSIEIRFLMHRVELKVGRFCGVSKPLEPFLMHRVELKVIANGTSG